MGIDVHSTVYTMSTEECVVQLLGELHGPVALRAAVQNILNESILKLVREHLLKTAASKASSRSKKVQAENCKVTRE